MEVYLIFSSHDNLKVEMKFETVNFQSGQTKTSDAKIVIPSKIFFAVF